LVFESLKKPIFFQESLRPTTSQKAVFAFAFWGEVVESDS